MLYLEDYLEMIEHLPTDLRDRFTEMREMDLSVQSRVDSLEDRQKTFFAGCRKLKQGERDEEYEKIRTEYRKVIEDSSEKITIAEDCYNLVDRYLRKLDQELQKFQLELEADNRGITEILEKRSLEMDAPPSSTLKENRHPRKHVRKHHTTTVHSTLASTSGMSTPKTDHRKFNLTDTLAGLDPSGLASPGPSIPLQHMGPGGNAIATAAAQAIQATQQLVPGRRTSSLKASYEAINLGVQHHEFSIGRELAGAAQSALAATHFGSDGGPPPKRQKVKRNDQQQQQAVLDVVSGSLMDEGLLDPGQVSNLSPSTDDLLGGGGAEGGAGTPDGEWNYDPSEPRYCICNQVSYGDMVACDNEDCPYEWFHYPCVGITAPPKGKWYCPTCNANMQRRKGRK